ncbi:unnamed protein product [Zymoseptoria tritici ST99CH_1E4]|uniref:Uncharacterized protein n=1 Tax=Zymoseptoria tritici ST99CH_1E4 TaxID=1276532 RepID=A0A2H1GKZ9_ZYMTR|nr:unnamed protein product [Zymoseptoria tritici ST99CH_1E4]
MLTGLNFHDTTTPTSLNLGIAAYNKHTPSTSMTTNDITAAARPGHMAQMNGAQVATPTITQTLINGPRTFDLDAAGNIAPKQRWIQVAEDKVNNTAGKLVKVRIGARLKECTDDQAMQPADVHYGYMDDVSDLVFLIDPPLNKNELEHLIATDTQPNLVWIEKLQAPSTYRLVSDPYKNCDAFTRANIIINAWVKQYTPVGEAWPQYDLDGDEEDGEDDGGDDDNDEDQ